MVMPWTGVDFGVKTNMAWLNAPGGMSPSARATQERYKMRAPSEPDRDALGEHVKHEGLELKVIGGGVEQERIGRNIGNAANFREPTDPILGVAICGAQVGRVGGAAVVFEDTAADKAGCEAGARSDRTTSRDVQRPWWSVGHEAAVEQSDWCQGAHVVRNPRLHEASGVQLGQLQERRLVLATRPADVEAPSAALVPVRPCGNKPMRRCAGRCRRGVPTQMARAILGLGLLAKRRLPHRSWCSYGNWARAVTRRASAASWRWAIASFCSRAKANPSQNCSTCSDANA